MCAAGSPITQGQPLLQVHAASRQDAEQAVQEVLAACTIAPEPVDTMPLIHQRLG